MALSPPFPLNFFPSSHSLSLLQSQKTIGQSPNNFRNLYFKTLCSPDTTQLEIKQPQTTNLTSETPKKKRKPRPSFYEQIRYKWSLKTGSQRLNFPWQHQKQDQQQEGEGKEEEEGEEEEHVGNRVLDDTVSFYFGNRGITAPWTHRNKPHFHYEVGNAKSNENVSTRSKPHFSSEAEIAQTNRNISIISNPHFEYEAEVAKSYENVSVIGEPHFSFEEAKTAQSNEKVGMLSENEKDLKREVVSVGKYEEEVMNFDEVSVRLPWERRERSLDGDKWRRSNTALAEKTIPELELRRLRNVALRMKERIKVGSAGVTQALVDTITDKWKENEVVKMKFEGLSMLNMKRTHEFLESKTGGLVIWRSGSSLVLYRGMTYKLHCVQSYTKQSETNMNSLRHLKESKIDVVGNAGPVDSVTTAISSGAGILNASNSPSDEELKDIDDLNNLLDELGPRFKDWSGCDPLPVDADMLPCVLPTYKPPFRLLPSGVRPCLGNKDMTMYRRHARTMPPHFALGRNRELQGLAMAMVKLWKKSAVAKIAIKRGVLNTSSERMAEEIKKLTGGTLVSRNKDYIVFYRGNDFLSLAVTDVLVNRHKLVELQQVEEEKARQRASSALIVSNAKSSKGPLVAGTLAETMAANSRWGNQPSSEEIEKMRRDFSLARHASLVRYLEKKLTHAQEKVRKAEKALRKVQENLSPKDLPTDIETISDEERFLFRKMGLSMKPFLLLGRRGVFDGTVENMHLHWKYRELVKIIVKRKSYSLVKHIAISLEAESGGLLISVDKTMKGYEIIIYRGKNYQRPQAIKPDNLLTRRQALTRSVELQRREALNHHILDLLERIELLKSELDQVEAVKETGDDKLYTRLNGAYLSEDDFEDEDEDAYLKTYNKDDDIDKEEEDIHGFRSSPGREIPRETVKGQR